MKIYDASGFSSKLTGSFSGSFKGDGTNITGVVHNSGEIASEISGSFNELSESIATRFDGLTSDYTELTNIPSGILSSSAQFNALSNTSASYATTASFALSAGAGAGFPFSGSAVITGSLYVSGGFYTGDGSQLTNVNFNIITASTVSDTFTNAPSHSVYHYFGTKDVHISVFEGDTVLIPSSVTTPNVNQVDLVFNSKITGRAVVSKGGHLVSASLAETTTVVDNFSVTGSHTTAHNFNTKNVIVQVYDNNDRMISPSEVETIDLNHVKVTFSTSETGRVVVAKGGHYVTGTAVNVQSATSASYAATATTASHASSLGKYSVEYVTTAVTASMHSLHLLRGSVSMSLPIAAEGDWIKVSNRLTSSYAHLVPGGSQKIMGDSGSLEVNTDNAGFELIYADSTDGWVIIGQ